jgi:hypothetical protein
VGNRCGVRTTLLNGWPEWYNLRPDELAEYRVGQQRLRYWMEWDRGTMNRRDPAIKCTSYRHYLASLEWKREDWRLPFLVCVAPDIAQERRIQREARAKLTDALGLMLWTTTGVLLYDQGPLAPIWLQGIPRLYQVAQPGRLLRHRLFDSLLGSKAQ